MKGGEGEVGKVEIGDTSKGRGRKSDVYKVCLCGGVR